MFEIHIRPHGLSAAVALALLAAPLAAQEAGATPPVEPGFELASLVERALADSPVLAASRARLEAARAAARAAGALDDPTLGVEGRWLIPAGSREPLEAMVMVDQPLPGRGQRAAARLVAEAEVARAEVEQGRVEQRLLADVRGTWAELYALDRALRAMGESHELLDLMVATASALFGAGQESASAAIEPQLELSRHDSDVEAIEARFRAAAARLAALTGAAQIEAWPRVSGLPPVSFPKIDPATAAPVALGTVVAESAVRLADARLAAARAERAVDWSLGAGAIVMDGRDPNLAARIGVGLPVFRRDRVEPRIAAAQAGVDAARADRRVAELDARAELARLLAEGRRLDVAVRRYVEGVVPQASALLEATRIELLAGRGSLSATLAQLENWLEARVELARAEADRYIAWAELEAQLASPLAAPDPGGAR